MSEWSVKKCTVLLLKWAYGGLILERKSTVRLLDCQIAKSMPNKWLHMSGRLKLIRIIA